MSRTAPVEPQVVLKRPVITFNFVAEDIRSGVVPPLNGVASPYLAWDVHGGLPTLNEITAFRPLLLLRS